MLEQKSTKLEVFTQTTYGKRRFVIIEYEVTKKEINRYDLKIDEINCVHFDNGLCRHSDLTVNCNLNPKCEYKEAESK